MVSYPESVLTENARFYGKETKYAKQISMGLLVYWLFVLKMPLLGFGGLVG